MSKWCRLTSAAALLIAMLTGLAAFSIHAEETEVRVHGSVSEGNPKLFFGGIAGDEQFSAAMRTMLKSSGWFDLVNSPEGADYTLTGRAANGQAQVSVTMGGAPLINQAYRYNPQNPRAVAKTATDAVLTKIFDRDFDMKGIAKSQIAFCLEEAPGRINIYLCDIDGGNVRRVTEFTGMAVEPNWFPDGNSIAYTKYNKSNTSVVQTILNPLKSRTLATYNGMNVGVALHPKGNAMAVVMSKDKQVDLYLRTVEPGELRRLTKDSDVEASPAWNPSGTAICYAAGAYSGAKLYMVSPNGGNRTLLPKQKGDSVKPDWSADNKIVYSTKRNGEYTLAVVDANGGSKSKGFRTYENNAEGLVFPKNPGGNWESASWAPDNRHVVCSRRSGSSAQLFIVDTWTGKTRQLLSMKGRQLMPSWSPLAK